jgi:hypothetical protein
MHFALWPYALRNAALLHNSLPVLEEGTSRLELFSSIRVGSNMKHVHTFGCPVFALQNKLASGKSLPRWSPCPCLGLNLGPSPMHARNVYMVLPQGIMTAHGNSKDHVLKLEKNIYGQKQAGRVWNSFLVDKPMTIGFTPSLIDDCVFFQDVIIFMV